MYSLSSDPRRLADQSGQMYQFDELISVNGQDVSCMDHSNVVTLIKAFGTTITRELQQPQDLELVATDGEPATLTTSHCLGDGKSCLLLLWQYQHPHIQWGLPR